MLNIIGNVIGSQIIGGNGGIPSGITVDSTIYTADSTLITADNG